MRWRTRSASRSTRRCARCAGCSTAANGSRATRCTSTCCTPRIFSAMPTPSRWRATTPTAVERGLALKKAGNELHAPSRRAGDPSDQRARRRLLPRAAPRRARAAGRAAQMGARRGHRDTVRWVAGFDFPDCERDYEFVALRHPERISVQRRAHRVERGPRHRVPPSTTNEFRGTSRPLLDRAAVASAGGGGATSSVRWRATPELRSASGRSRRARPRGRARTGLHAIRSAASSCARSRSLYACERGAADDRRLRAARRGPSCRPSRVPARLWLHRGAARACSTTAIELDAEGTIRDAQIVPPTSQNQEVIEEDLRQVGEFRARPRDEALKANCEQSIRNHDPCISCAAHFLTLRVNCA